MASSIRRRGGDGRDVFQLWRVTAEVEMELLYANYREHVFPRHAHSTYTIGVVESGAKAFRCEGVDYVARPGDVFVLDPGRVHTGRAVGGRPCRYRAVYPTTEMFELATSSVPVFASPVISDKVLARKLVDIHTQTVTPRSDSQSRPQLMSWLSDFAAAHGAPGNARSNSAVNESIARAKAYLTEHYTENMPIEELATHVGLSTCHLIHAFKSCEGITPHAYVVNLRIQSARAQLQSHHPIAHVAAELGFADQSHLTRTFKKIVGVTPGQYVSALPSS